jgi:hypothetical protein
MDPMAGFLLWPAYCGIFLPNWNPPSLMAFLITMEPAFESNARQSAIAETAGDVHQ